MTEDDTEFECMQSKCVSASPSVIAMAGNISSTLNHLDSAGAPCVTLSAHFIFVCSGRLIITKAESEGAFGWKYSREPISLISFCDLVPTAV